MAEVVTAMEIEAPVQKVWNLLLDFPSYPRWNPLIPKAEGFPSLGSTITIHLQLPVGALLPIPVQVSRFEPEKTLEWVSEIPILGFLLQGRHYHRLEALDEARTRFIHGEEFTGLVEPLLRPFLENELISYYRDFNFALKQEAERPQ